MQEEPQINYNMPLQNCFSETEDNDAPITYGIVIQNIDQTQMQQQMQPPQPSQAVPQHQQQLQNQDMQQVQPQQQAPSSMQNVGKFDFSANQLQCSFVVVSSLL